MGLSASDIGRAERGEKDLTQAELKSIAKATGVTQKSLLEAAGTAMSQKAGLTSKKTRTVSGNKLTVAETKLLELYRKADADTKKAAIAVLKGETLQPGKMVSSILNNKTVKNALSGMLGKGK